MTSGSLVTRSSKAEARSRALWGLWRTASADGAEMMTFVAPLSRCTWA